MKKRLKKLSKRATALIVCAAIVGSIAIVCLSMQIAFMQADKIKCWTPSYEKADISAMLDAPEAERDYALLYRQTGLTKAGIDRCLERSDGKRRILDIQSDYFGKYEVENGFFAPFVCTDYIDKYISHVFLEDVAAGVEESRLLCNSLKECLSNGIRHGKATAFYVELKKVFSEICLYISDNGIGVNGEIKEGFGLKGMREKVEKLGGRCIFSSEAGEGFETEIALPLKKNNEKRV